VEIDKRQAFEAQASRYLKRICGLYSLGSGGLYEPAARQSESAHGCTPSAPARSPLRVYLLRDLPALIISALTLILLFFTVRYTRRQWLEENRAANGSEISGHAAQSAAETASNTLIEMEHGQGAADTHSLAEAAVVSSRAWIAPIQVILETPIESGPPVRYQLQIVNPGREPAIGAVWRTIPYGVPYVQERSEPNEPDLPPNNTCSGLIPNPTRGYVLYPEVPVKFWTGFTIENSAGNRSLLRRVQDRKATLIIDGCVAYIASGARHTSEFRFLLRDAPGPSMVLGKDGMIPGWNFNPALTGNQAN
jgi:hypothetical protein